VNRWPEPDWDQTRTDRIIRQLFPMFELTVDGISEAAHFLAGSRHAA